MNIGESFYCSKCMREISDEEEKCPYCGHDPYQPQNVQALEEGTLLQNSRYQLGAVIGRGGFGITYAAWDIMLNQPVAVKEYYPINLCERDATEDNAILINPGSEGLYQAGLDRFIREARILGTLQNLKNVVPVLEWFEDNNTAYIIMRYIRGVTLAEYVETNHIKPQEVISMMRDIIDSLILIHKQGIIHRDISPYNIMVQEDGTLILIDFGAASLEEQMAQGKNKTAIYNRRYAPIEQYDESGMQGSFTDVYALSATLYHLVCGEPPTESAARQINSPVLSPKERGVHLKKYQSNAIMKGLSLQPEKRPQTMEVFRSLLYDLPMPEEVLQRRRFMFSVISIASVISLAAILTVMNFAYGFYLGGGLRYSLHSDGLHVRRFSSDSERVSIPSSIAGISVVQIDEGAFQGVETLKDAELPGTVKKVDRFAFNSCKNLTNLTLKEGVRELGSQSFANCETLQAVMTPSTLTDIAPDAFHNSERRLVLFGEMDAPASQLADGLGIHYAHIESLSNDSGLTITKYETRQNSVIIPDKIDGKLVTALESGTEAPIFSVRMQNRVQNIILPHNLEKIGDYALSHLLFVKRINLPETLKYIGKRAFSESVIESVSLPDSVNFVGDEAFSSCLYLQSVRLSPNMREIPYGCFAACEKLVLVDIPDGITEIRSHAFTMCTSLREFNVPEGVRIIENYAFLNCSSLESLYLPKSLARMLPSAVVGCPNTLAIIGYKDSFAHYFSSKYGFKFYDLDSVDENIKIMLGDYIMPGGYMWIEPGIASSDEITLPSYSAFSKASAARRIFRGQNLRSKKVTLPEHMEIVTANSFKNNLVLESLDCPSELVEIEASAFEGCINLKTVNLKEGLRSIGVDAFLNCVNLADINLPSTLRTINYGAFENCSSLTHVEIPPSIVTLDPHAFAGTGITSLTIPGSVSKCDPAFTNCKSLREVIVSEGVRMIWGTFEGCDALEEVRLPSTIQQISRSSFIGCTNLKDIWIYSDNVELDKIVYPISTNTYLFADSPNLTIHAHRKTNAYVYALTHNIKFEEIPAEEGENVKPAEVHFKYDGRIYSDDRLLQLITPNPVDTAGDYWSKFQYARGYGMVDLMYQCLEAFENAGDAADKLCAVSARLFLTQAEALGYKLGRVIALFENDRENPVLRVGDIIVAVEGHALDDENISSMGRGGDADTWEITILRPENGVLRELEVTISRDYPASAEWDLSPLTYESL